MRLFGRRKDKEDEDGKVKKKAILVIDDDEDIVRYLQFLLEEAGYNVSAAYKGGEGLESAKRNCPDLILLDINLPTLGGFQLCRELKSNDKTKHIPVIMVSAQEKMSDYVRAAQEGAVAYVGKPIHKEELLTKIRKHLL